LIDLGLGLGLNLGAALGIQLPAKVVGQLAGDIDQVFEDMDGLDGPDVAFDLDVVDDQEVLIGEESPRGLARMGRGGGDVGVMILARGVYQRGATVVGLDSGGWLVVLGGGPQPR
jgi:hypothetical protein